MARLARVVVPDYPHHVIQRGNRRQQIFFKENDKRDYLDLLHEQSLKYRLKIWAYCLMDNHVHLIVVPELNDSLSRALGETHKRYTRVINLREQWRGHLWESRFKSFVLDAAYLYSAVRYVERNPVRANIVDKASQYRWSSASSHITGNLNPILTRFYLEDQIQDWETYLQEEDLKEVQQLRENSNKGRPLGDKDFIENLEIRLNRKVGAQKRGRKMGKRLN